MDEDFLIHIDIADKKYPLRINRKDEELVRKAAKQIDMKYMRCRARFSRLVEKEDLLAMVAFRLSKENLLLEDKNDPSPFIKEIQLMTELIDTYLEKNI